MAYALRYYKEVPQRDGGTIRLEIYKKDSTAGAIEIGGVVRSLALEIQGQQGDIDTPIVKTSLSMSFVDAQDIENGKKNGFWEEFYTPDAVLWQVVLKAKDAKETAFRTIWGGYVTPDSFSESLVYRGDVTIIARDNIGHLQDFSFDAQGNEDGQITLYDLVSAGWAKIESPMGLDFSSGNWLMCDGVPAYNTRLNVSAFEGMNWYQAIEKALYAYGLVMRYRGENNVMVCSLRDMTKYGQYSEDYLPHLEPKFVTGATRELVPAVKKIEEKTEYDLEDSMIMPQVTESDYSGKIETTSLSTSSGVSFVLYDWHISNKEDGKGWKDSDKPIYFNPSGYDVTEVVESKDNEYMWLSSSAYIGGPLRYSEFNKYFNASKLTVEMSFGSVYRLVSGALKIVGESAVFPTQVALGVYVDDGYTERWLDAGGEWVSTQQTLTVALENGKMSLPIPLDAYSGKVLLGIRVYSVASTWELDVYTPLYSLSLHEDAILRATNTVNTILNDSNNVVLSRKPELASAFDNVALPGVIKNGIFYKKGDVVVPAHSWAWSGGTPQQMSVYNHLQLLAYFAKPFNLISGTIVNADLTRVATLFVWGGSEHVLVSGRYNFLSGQIESAQLRGFYRYEDIWSEVSGVSEPDVEEGTQNNIDKKSSSSNASTYTATQTVNIGTGGGGGASSLNDLQDVDTTGVTANCVLYFNGTQWVEKNVDNLLEDYVQKSTLDSLWKIDPQTGRLVTTHPVEIGNNLIVRGESASGGGAGQPSVAGIIGIRVNGHTYYDKDDGVEDGIIDLGTISGGGGGDIDLSAYLTKTAAAQTYLPLAGGTISGSDSNPLKINTTAVTSFLTFQKSGANKASVGWDNGVGAYIGNDVCGYALCVKDNGTPVFYDTKSNTLIHSGNIGSYAPVYDGSGNVSIGESSTSSSIINRLCLSNAGATKGAGAAIIFGYDKTMYHAKIAGIYESQSPDYLRPALAFYTMSNSYAAGSEVERMRITSGGNILVGTTTDSGYKFDVNGNARVSGNLIVKGESAVGSDVRYKDRIEDVTMDLQTMANAPLFTFRWNDREDKTAYLGTSAQYWEEHRSELVQGEDFKVLNYASLGVAMGISLAKKALDHEQRIKVLEDENKQLKERLYGKVC